jgi:hypothetical protein
MIYSEGPWTAEQECLNSIEIQDGNGRTIATVMVEEEDEISEESRANAQLMVLAPEMHRALTWALSIIEPIKEQWTEETDEAGPTKTAQDFMQQLSRAQQTLASVTQS